MFYLDSIENRNHHQKRPMSTPMTTFQWRWHTMVRAKERRAESERATVAKKIHKWIARWWGFPQTSTKRQLKKRTFFCKNEHIRAIWAIVKKSDLHIAATTSFNTIESRRASSTSNATTQTHTKKPCSEKWYIMGIYVKFMHI